MKNNPGTPFNLIRPLRTIFYTSYTTKLKMNLRQGLDKADCHDNTDFPDLDKPVPELGFLRSRRERKKHYIKRLLL